MATFPAMLKSNFNLTGVSGDGHCHGGDGDDHHGDGAHCHYGDDGAHGSTH